MIPDWIEHVFEFPEFRTHRQHWKQCAKLLAACDADAQTEALFSNMTPAFTTLRLVDGWGEDAEAQCCFFSLPPSPGEGPLTATKTSAPRRGRTNRAALGFYTGFLPGFVPAPPKIHGNLQI